MKRLALVVLVACGVRTPASIDTTTLVEKRGPVEARRDLIIRVLAEPRDVAARLALAALDVRLGFPADAIDQLEAVVALGGPFGPRWHDVDRGRLASLLVSRGHARISHGSRNALRDLERARHFGAQLDGNEVVLAKEALGIALLRHVDGALRAKGRALLLWPLATIEDAGAFGVRAWTVGARREAYEQLSRWYSSTQPPRDPAIEAAYLRARAWWSPSEAPAEPSPPAPEPGELAGNPREVAAVRYASARTGAGIYKLAPIAEAFTRDATIAERLSRDYVATSPDAALAHATIGALFDVLGDPARARISWQAAVDASTSPRIDPPGNDPSEADALYVRGLAEACARANDPSAALLFATTAAAAWGDPAVVWTSVAAALHASRHDVEALTAARSALDLAGPDILPRALEVAIAASRALGRTPQADALSAERVPDPLDAVVAAYEALPTAGTLARVWVASTAHPRSVELLATLHAALAPDDPRRAHVDAQLVSLATDADSELAFAAAAALR